MPFFKLRGCGIIKDMSRKSLKQICYALIVIGLILPFLSQGNLIDDLNDKISQQEQKRIELERKAQEYQQVINQKQGEIRSLNNEIAILNAQIGKLETEIQLKEDEIYQTELEILQLKYGMEKSDKKIENHKENLAEVIRAINQYDQTGDLEIVLGSEDFSDFFNQIAYMEKVQANIRETVEDLKHLKEQLAESKETEEGKKESLVSLKEDLLIKQNSLSSQKSSRRFLLDNTKGEEDEYQSMLANIESQKRELLGDINQLKQQKAAELARLKALQQKPPKQYWASTSWFYRQDDPRWENSTIGWSRSTLGDYGCAISSVAMVFTYHGLPINPPQLAKKPIFHNSLIVWPRRWNNLQLATLTFRQNIDWFKLDREIGAGYPVIVRIQAIGRSGGHYIVIHTKTDDGRYVVHDPLFGDNIYLSSSQAYIGKLYDSSTKLNQMIIYH